MENIELLYIFCSLRSSAFCCAGILCSVRLEQKSIEELMYKLYSFPHLRSVSRIYS